MRLFLAITLPDDVKEALSGNQWPDLPARWLKKEGLHVTVAFLGQADNDREYAFSQKPFSLKFSRISYGPSGTFPPRMVWAVGESSSEFVSLAREAGGVDKDIVPHITLARIKEWEWKRINPEERPEINEPIDINVQVNSVDLYQSILKRTGAEYKLLKRFKLSE